MIRKFELLVPDFLKNLDKKLLLNNPVVWASKIHYVLFFSIIGYLLLGLKVAISPINLQDVPNPENQIFVVAIPAALAILMWGYRVSLFSVTQNFGILSDRKELFSHLLYFASVAMIALSPVAYSYMLSTKMAYTINDSTLSEDINTLNIGSHYFIADSYKLDQMSRGEMMNDEYTPYYYYDANVLNSNELKNVVRNNRTRGDKLAAIDNFKEVFYKYSGYEVTVPSEDVLASYEGREIANLYIPTYDVEHNIDIIAKAKSSHFFFMDWEMTPFMIFVIYGLGLLAILFVKTDWKKIVLAGIVGMGGLMAAGMLMGLYSSLFRHSLGIREESFAILLFFGTFIFMLFQGSMRRNTRRLNNWKSIALILAALMTPFVPFFLFLTIDQVSSYYAYHNWDNKEIFSLIFYGGVALSFLSMHFFYTQKFTDNHAHPKQD